MKLFDQLYRNNLEGTTRRHFLRDCSTGLGALWLASANSTASASSSNESHHQRPSSLNRQPHFQPKAKRVIFLHMAGGPSQHEMFVNKPELTKFDGQDCPQEFLEGKRFAFIRGTPQLLGPNYTFQRAGECGAWVSDRLPEFAKVVDDVCFIHSMSSDQFNHAPAQLLLHTGNQNLGYASMGSWATYGLGTENQDMPGYMVLLSGGQVPSAGKSVWGSGFLPSVYQGVQCRSKGDPVLFLSNPKQVSRSLRRNVVDAIGSLNERAYQEFSDPETATRISQYEMAFRMQVTATDAFGISEESQPTLEMYGAQPGKESFANNCLLARRLVERGVRFVQLFDWGWDMHGNSEGGSLGKGLANKCRQIDRPMSALLRDLKQRGLLEDTLVVWGGEFGRTPMQENRGGKKMAFKGRDHHPHAFTMWLAGAGVTPGCSYGETDPLGYEPVQNKVLVRDLHATMLHLLGLDHQRLNFPFQGLKQKLTGVKPAKVVDGIIA